MFTQSIVPKSNRITIQLPDDFVGEEVRLIAVVEKTLRIEDRDKKQEDIRKRYADYPRINLSEFKFDRNEANNFDE